ncbi:DUF302 domain-containing protein [Bhargavaea beijingensis]|uniref:DUF302 domain-containing protein n=1 Tax=Bhargavaea beijingensis TaxID=426756 RepID=A0A1G6XJ10_9BACL|nr:DUF302 domain-containing protein [Bhargavaea beijingensis]MCW1928064.1 DUF302 domain-containing protein [Bhargavaea beijingensis]RSK34290.1 DUF302 domain-containing protein [Bhargavaea beijingensis]SDD78188.1 Uncharacterized conserved protein, DUF302 family [Bhargavaea beijingensis]
MFDYTMETAKSREEAISALKEELAGVQFGVLWELDMTDTLQQKGQDFDKPITILEVCNPAAAAEVLKKELRIGYLLPCKIAVYEDGGKTHIGMPKPTQLLGLTGREDMIAFAGEIEETMKAVIDRAAK